MRSSNGVGIVWIKDNPSGFGPAVGPSGDAVSPVPGTTASETNRWRRGLVSDDGKEVRCEKIAGSDARFRWAMGREDEIDGTSVAEYTLSSSSNSGLSSVYLLLSISLPFRNYD